MKQIIFLAIFLLMSGVIFSDTYIEGGEVSGIWSVAGSPYLINGDISIIDGATLQVFPGVQIIFSDHYQLSVSGRLVAEGTAVDSIFWTVADTTGFSNDDFNTGGWGGINFDYLCDDNDTSILSFNRLEFGKSVDVTAGRIAGGAVCVDSCSNVVISFNTIINNKALSGGGIACVSEASPVIEFNTVIYNRVSGAGGGILCDSTTDIVIDGNNISNNHAYSGGGIKLFSENGAEITNNMISGNYAHIGAGIQLLLCSGIISDNIITHNTATQEGGGICLYAASDLEFENNYVAHNSSGFYGGGLYNAKSDELYLTDNIFEFNSAVSGGGMCDYNEGGWDIYMSGNSIRYNNAQFRGGGINWSCPSLYLDEINRNSIYLNSAKFGYDLHSYNFNETVVLDTFTVAVPVGNFVFPVNTLDFDIQHYCLEQYDADIFVSLAGDDTNSGLTEAEPLQTITQALKIILPEDEIRTIHLAEGIYSSGSNGEIFPVVGFDNVQIAGAGRSATILDAESDYIHFYINGAENFRIRDLTIRNANSAIEQYWNYYQGAIYCLGSSISLENLEISDNSGGSYGGGIYLKDNSYCELYDVKISNNSVLTSGGAIYCKDASEVFLDKCEISDNYAACYENYPGAAINCQNNSRAVITNSTVVNNTASEGCGVFCDISSTLILANTICRNDAPHEIISGQMGGNAEPVLITYSNLTNGEQGVYSTWGEDFFWLEGNIDEDPLFVDPQQGDYRLNEDSPCVDSGIDSFTWNEEVIIDLAEGEYYGTAPDMGCYEYGLVNTDELKIENVKCKISNYPNPFNPETVVSFYLAEEGVVELTVLNLRGQLVRSLMKSDLSEPGEHSVVWRGDDDRGNVVGSGVYFIRLDIEGERSLLRKCVLLK